ncbi:hypothetical protein FEM48_Zijuj04G0099900 [Ziziphus jujuba var. spinosa]|uniref:Retrotransposon Copia-like N-terminal domain-containing protein n=1 Tax=Ziziphus jujuba var. spinosa TaxID=714518 RepID=A0A978VJ82_ZIZJJ|nr:hypothetical protein FEM48_Zijuj04G0099900 [Ziziphus jujuba var. spinosa]
MSKSNSTNTDHSPNNNNNYGILVYINVSAQAPLKLTTDNYTAWHAQWYSLFGYDLMGFVTGASVCPPSNPDKILWIRQDHLLRSALLASFDPTIVTFVASSGSSREAWQTLATMYAKPSHGRITSIRDTLSKLTKDDKSISIHIDSSITFAELHDKLADYEAFLNRNGLTTGYVSLVTTNYASYGGHSSPQLYQPPS